MNRQRAVAISAIGAMAVVAFSITGCATLRAGLAGDSRSSHTVRCSGDREGWENCLDEASRYCGQGGFEELSRDDDSAATHPISQSADGFDPPRADLKTRAMVVACKRR